ncbi:MAG: energy transducer TonB, partial [Saprospiraceae bacterium]|nr:energy transducer TonB [Saprospiraceae bacterium]
MNAQFAVTSNQLLLAIAVMFVLLVALIAGGRIVMRRRSEKDLGARYRDAQDQRVRPRSKYPEVDIFQYSGIFKRVGLIFTLATILFMVNWTTYEQTVYIPDDALLLDEEIAVEPPRTAEPPPPPPPPPPPVIQEVPDEMILEEEDDLEFMDQSIEAESVVEVTETVAEEVAEDIP